MAESTRLVDLVQDKLDSFVATREQHLGTISSDLVPFVDASRFLLSGGKRFRALFCYLGWDAVSSASESDRASEHESVIAVASGLEAFHAAALVHDDLVDNSDTRRGEPAAHRRYETMHRAAGWIGDAEPFGRSAALLLGDLLLGWSDELVDDGLDALASRSAARAARTEFTAMRNEVTYGQYLDLLEEHSWNRRHEHELLERAHRVIVFKSAKYSVEAPLAIGAALGGASTDQLASLREFGLPLGIAFQLRDDLLGVFGDPEVTGKPAGDDLREGKRTVLVALAREGLSASSSRLLDELLGDPELTADQITMLQRSLHASGAVDAVERLITEHTLVATRALESSTCNARVVEQLTELAHTVSQRAH